MGVLWLAAAQASQMLQQLAASEGGHAQQSAQELVQAVPSMSPVSPATEVFLQPPTPPPTATLAHAAANVEGSSIVATLREAEAYWTAYRGGPAPRHLSR